MKITKIEKVGKFKVYDITVADNHQYVLGNGVVTHNTGLIYSSNQAFIIGKSQEKDGTELVGYNFTINIEKSRFVREKSKLPFTVTYEDGVQMFSGLMDLALESGHCIKPKNGWYARIDVSTGEIIDKNYRLKDTNRKEFWNDILSDQKFKDFVSSKFKLNSSLMSDISEDIAETFASIDDEDE